ncbi:MAG: hypothetical protein ACI957_003268 [Verrucomicrobiales bacterium]|jgi:hypothetical protein
MGTSALAFPWMIAFGIVLLGRPLYRCIDVGSVVSQRWSDSRFGSSDLIWHELKYFVTAAFLPLSSLLRQAPPGMAAIHRGPP